jgi:hypothetical protein
MATIMARDKSHDELERIKKNIENSYEYSKPNFDCFNTFCQFVFVTSITDTDTNINKRLKRPNVEVNEMEAYISRLRGEFSKNMPGLQVSGRDGAKADPQMIKVIEDHIRHILDDANKDGFEYNIYTDTLAGGFSSAKVYTDYNGEMSFHQDIYLRRTFDPTMTGFDPMARKDDKSDGDFCFELYPMRVADFKREFPDVKLDNVSYTTELAGFNWAYSSNNEDIVIVGDYYEKKKTRKKIVMLANGLVVTMKRYKEYLKAHMMSGAIEQAIAIVGQPRMTTTTEIIRKRVMQTQILSAEETDYDSLPLVFFDGNSAYVKDTDNSSVHQVTRPVVYHAKGAQRTKNYAIQALVNELENINQGQFIAAMESIPADNDIAEMYRNPQQANVLIYKQFMDDDTTKPLNPPQVLNRRNIPPEIMQTVQQSGMWTQQVLGAFDSNLSKMTEKQVSGIAIQETVTLSNATAMPYVVGFFKGMQGVCNRILELIPKIYTTPRSIPLMSADGKKSYVLINQEGGMKLDYDKNALQIKIQPGPSFGAQKEKAFNAMVAMQQVSPPFAQFMAEEGMPEMLDNIPDVRNIDILKEKSEVWSENMKKMKAEMAKKQPPDPNVLFAQVEQEKNQGRFQVDMAKLQQESEQFKVDTRLELEKLGMERQKLQVEVAQTMAEIEKTKIEALVEIEKAKIDNEGKVMELVRKTIESSNKMENDNKKLQSQLAEKVSE